MNLRSFGSHSRFQNLEDFLRGSEEFLLSILMTYIIMFHISINGANNPPYRKRWRLVHYT